MFIGFSPDTTAGVVLQATVIAENSQHARGPKWNQIVVIVEIVYIYI